MKGTPHTPSEFARVQQRYYWHGVFTETLYNRIFAKFVFLPTSPRRRAARWLTEWLGFT